MASASHKYKFCLVDYRILFSEIYLFPFNRPWQRKDLWVLCNDGLCTHVHIKLANSRWLTCLCCKPVVASLILCWLLLPSVNLWVLSQLVEHSVSTLTQNRDTSLSKLNYRNDPKFLDRQVSLSKVYTVCYSVYIFWTHYSMGRVKRIWYLLPVRAAKLHHQW